MKLHQLPQTLTKAKKRLGRGYGSGVGGHTSTRGQKGQKSRSKVKIWFEGGQLPLTKKIPFLRGKKRFKGLESLPHLISISLLNTLKPQTVVTKDILVKEGIISLKEATSQPLKILGNGELTVALTIKDLNISQRAADKVKQAGGEIINS